MTRDIYDCLYCGLQFKEDERKSSEGESAEHYGQELKKQAGRYRIYYY